MVNDSYYSIADCRRVCIASQETREDVGNRTLQNDDDLVAVDAVELPT